MSAYSQLRSELERAPKTWLVTGAAGFIGSNLAETLLKLRQRVIGLDNFSTGKRANLQEARRRVGAPLWQNFRLLEGDIKNPAICRRACAGADFVLHQAALGSVPNSIARPAEAHTANVTGFLNILMAARDAKVKRFVYASSSAVYGDDPQLPKLEDKIGNSLSPYAATKLMDEIYAGTFARVYGIQSVGLRYFNVFGPRQDPKGAYAAVIPKWIASLLKQEPVVINGDGETSRDFCFVEDVVQANLLAATARPEAANQVYNVGLGQRTTLNELFEFLQTAVRRVAPRLAVQKPTYREFRAGDVRHSLASVEKARRLLGYEPVFTVGEGLDLAMRWYRKSVA